MPHQPSVLQAVTASPGSILPLVPQEQELYHKIARKLLSALAVLTQTLPQAPLQRRVYRAQPHSPHSHRLGIQAPHSQRPSQPGEDSEQNLTGERSGRSHLCCWAVRPQRWPGLPAIPTCQLQCRAKGPELEFEQQQQAVRHTP